MLALGKHARSISLLILALIVAYATSETHTSRILDERALSELVPRGADKIEWQVRFSSKIENLQLISYTFALEYGPNMLLCRDTFPSKDSQLGRS